MFGMGKKETTVSEETSKSNVWGSQLSAAVAEARKGGMDNAGGTTGKRKTGPKSESGPSVSREMEAAAAKMFDPEAWRAIVRAPFALGQVMTGRKCWALDKTQEDTLTISTSSTAEYFLQTDPKYVALTLFVFNWSVVLTEKFMANAVERQKEQASEPQPPNAPLKAV